MKHFELVGQGGKCGFFMMSEVGSGQEKLKKLAVAFE